MMELKKTNFVFSIKKTMLESLKLPVISITLGLIVGGVIIAFSGSNPLVAIKGLAVGGFGSMHALTVTLTRATPIIFAGLSAALAWGSGYSSMGALGQMVLGSFTAAIVAVSLPGPPMVIIVVSLLAGMLVGVIYSLIAAYISAKFDVYLLIITLMMNYIADNVASYFTTYDFRDPLATDRLAVQTQKITDAALPRIVPTYILHYGFVIAVVCTLFVLFLMQRTSFGYKAKMSGLNPKFADYGGINSLKTMYLVLMLSGALAGLGGACEALGTRFRYSRSTHNQM
ncbi:MAG TPA: ABC transporter permease, partial [Thermoanaerobacterales bacterium]|nr:ABC transporter permease [Thermoanaerobacterales bacterium]